MDALADYLIEQRLKACPAARLKQFQLRRARQPPKQQCPQGAQTLAPVAAMPALNLAANLAPMHTADGNLLGLVQQQLSLMQQQPQVLTHQVGTAPPPHLPQAVATAAAPAAKPAGAIKPLEPVRASMLSAVTR